MSFVRRARPEDARQIHDAHMRSINEICAKDYSVEEVRAWGGRIYDEKHRISAIKNHMVWVVEEKGVVQGYGHLVPDDKTKVAFLWGLYLTPDVIGRGHGEEICKLMFVEAKALGMVAIALESTITAQRFYKGLGFKEIGPQRKVEINGVEVRCFPMELKVV